MTNLILVITTASQTTPKHSGFSNRTLVIWVMNLQFGDGHLAETACLYSIITRVQLGRLACLGLEYSEVLFTPAPSTWASGWSDV